MDRTRRPAIETRVMEEDRPRAIGAGSQETSRIVSAPRADRFTSGILRELAEQMRHWD